ncbi:hypothetical protein QRX50_46770 [Amycolatopsis carbonis]|uniref:Uncharacterized protein n=1 Tax=Amycolatopsis carbonis TaxID=715471 RepID=A0A9Y2IET5_9PSEU|nr:hypothetical protein [Amycolatopsis sp. 2-15]WIX78757.1 hypothetical protein QRX50_46770 [Amycolatopsis sp. 2-15]
MEVPWNELAESPRKAERLFDMLLHRLYPNRVRTINGAGGDGGVDAWLDRRHAIEFKSFTRLGKVQQRQIERSLERAAEQGPSAWTVIAPVSLTPASLAWFDRLQENYDFPLTFRDRAWLDERLAMHDDIVKFVCLSPSDAVVGVLRELNAEQAALTGGVPDLAQRVTALQARAGGASPFWQLNFTAIDGQVGVQLSPKPGARPEPISVTLAVPSGGKEADLVARLTEAVDYGAGVVVSPELIHSIDSESLTALGVSAGEIGFTLPARLETAHYPRSAVLRAVGQPNPLRPPLQLTLIHATAGRRGVVVHGTDSTGLLHLQVRIDHPSDPDDRSELGVHFSYGHGGAPGGFLHVDPDALLRTARALGVLADAASLQLLIDEAPEPIPLTDRSPSGNGAFFDRLADALQDLLDVRDALGLPVRVPEEWPGRDLVELHLAAELLRGKTVELPVRLGLAHQSCSADETRRLIELVEAGDTDAIFPLEGMTFTVTGREIPVSPLYLRMRPAITNLPEVRAALERGASHIDIDIAPDEAAPIQAQMKPFADRSSGSSPLPSSRS